MCSSSPGTELCSPGIIPLKAALFLVKCLSPCKRWRGGELSTGLSRPSISSGSSGANAWSISQKRQRTPAGLSFAIEPGMMDVPRLHASLLRAARIVRDFSREMTSPPCRSAMPRAIPPEMKSSGACTACSFMPSAEGMKGSLRSRMTARAKMAKASEGGQTYLAAHLRGLSFEILVAIGSHGHVQSNLWTMHLSYASLASIERVFRWERQGGRIAVPTIHAMKNCRAAGNAAPHCRLVEPESENLSASISDFIPRLE
jgi:hypothetical protein